MNTTENDGKLDYITDKLLDGLKLLGTGNGAGAIGGIAILNFLITNSKLEHIIVVKVVTGLFIGGVLSFAVSLWCFLASIAATIGSKEMHESERKVATAGLSISIFVAYVSLASFIIACLTGLFALYKL
jgi:hypothetical protein